MAEKEEFNGYPSRGFTAEAINDLYIEGIAKLQKECLKSSKGLRRFRPFYAGIYQLKEETGESSKDTQACDGSTGSNEKFSPESSDNSCLEDSGKSDGSETG